MLASRSIVLWPVLLFAPQPPRRLIEAATAIFAAWLLVANLLAQMDIVPSASGVRIGVLGYDWRQYHPGIIPSVACVYLMLGTHYQRPWLKVLSCAGLLSTGSLTGWIWVWPSLFGWRALWASACIWGISFALGGDPQAKVSVRAVEEAAHALSFPAGIAISAAMGAYGLWVRDRMLVVLAALGMRFGSGLWLDPFILLYVASLSTGTPARR